MNYLHSGFLTRLTAALFIWTFASVNASADILDDIVVTEPIFAVDGSTIDIEALRNRILNIEQHVDDDDPRSLIRWPSRDVVKFKPEIFETCGQDVDFENFFALHGYQQFQLTSDDRELLSRCLTEIFKFADENISVPAPGLYRRFSPSYVERSIEIGYHCGFRTKRSFSMFSLSVWLVHIDEIAELQGFKHTCLNSRPAGQVFSDPDYESGATDIVNRALHPLIVFGNWGDAVRYSAYANLVERNWEIAACREMLQDGQRGEFEVLETFLDSDCHLTLDLRE